MMSSVLDVSDHSQSTAPKSGWEVFETASSNVTEQPRQQNHADAETGTDKDTEKLASMFQASHSHTPGSQRNIQRPQTSRSTYTRSPRFNSSSAIPNVKAVKSHEEGNSTLLSAIFCIEKTSYDVKMFEDRITWTPVSAVFKTPSKLENSVDRPLLDCGVVYTHEISAVRLKNIRNMKAKTVTTIGFAIFTAGSKGEKLREQCTLFLCYSREICVVWATKIKAAIMARKDRPTRLLVISPNMFPSSSAWSSIVEPRLQTVGIKFTIKELEKGGNVSDYIKSIMSEQSVDEKAFHGLLVMGKLPFFSEVISAVMEYNKQSLTSGTWNSNIPTIGYIPSSPNNFVGKELHRCSDPETAVLHAIYGCLQSIPICEFYDKDGNFLRYGMTATYGYSGGDTMSERSTTRFGYIQGSFKKSLAFTKAIVQRRSYACEIMYKDAALKFQPYDDEELFAEQEFAKFSIVNEHYVDDEQIEASKDGKTPSSNSDKQASSDSDSGVWPQRDNWDKVQRKNYLDVMVTSLPQHFNEEAAMDPPLSALLVRETMSRKDLFVNMGSKVSLSSNASKTKPEVLDKTDVVKGTEIIVKPCIDQGPVNSHTSKWCIDDICLEPTIQELHVKVAEFPILMYSRGSGQALTSGSNVNILRLDTDDSNITVESLA